MFIFIPNKCRPFALLSSAPTPAKDQTQGNIDGADKDLPEDAAAAGGVGGGAMAEFFSPLGMKTSNGTTPNRDGTTQEDMYDEEMDARPSNIGGKNKKRNLEEAYARKAQAERIMKRVRSQQRRAPVETVSDDEEHFAKRESARLQRDIAKLNPITLGTLKGAPTDTATADGAADAPRAAQSVYIKAPKGAPKTAAPQIELAANTSVVDAVTSTDFDDLAGMDDVVRQLREMVLLPLQYPELFRQLGVSPPRGILFHGVPGTGKTLAARALAGACARHSPVPVTFFARKGADCLGKFVGEAERTLRLMFQEASTRAPAIIFLDELDALVPARGRGAGHQDQIHASVVSTLLTLMDGMADRGNVVVIASTNRPEDIDPALRRPGRFDREVYFGLPQTGQREAILKAHTRRWDAVPSEELMKTLASVTDGYAGADLAALCTAAVMSAVRRGAPQLLQHAEALADGQATSGITSPAPSIPDIRVEQIDWDAALAAAPPPCSKRHAAQALAADALRSMSYHTAPLLLPVLVSVLETVGKSVLPVPLAVKQATQAITTIIAEKNTDTTSTKVVTTAANAGVESTLAALGAIERAPDHLLDTCTQTPLPTTPPGADVAAPGPSNQAATAINHTAKGTSNGIGAACPPLRLLISGTDDAGQDQIAGAVLRLFGGSQVSVLSLPAVVAEGAGDAAQGVVALVQAALQRAERQSTLVLYLPHVEAWAVAPDVVTVVQNDDHNENNLGSPAAAANGSRGGGGALSPMSPSFAGLSSRSLRIGSINNHDNSDKNHVGDSTVASMPASDAWIAFESMIQEAAPQQPLLILATTTAPHDLLPSNLTSVFTYSGGIVNIDSSWDRNTVEKKVEMVDEVETRVEERAKSALAGHAAAVFIEHVAIQNVDMQKNTRDHAAALSDPLHTTNTTTPAAAAVADSQLDLLKAKRKAVNLNNSEWERAQELFTSVQRFLVALGATLAKDKRCRAAGATFPERKKPYRPRPVEHVRLYTITLAAAQGRYLSLEQFQGAIARAVASISKAAEEEGKTGQELLHDVDALNLSFSIQDQIASACHALRTSLELDDPVNARLLRAATGFAADVALVYQEKEAEAVVAAMAAEEAAEAAEAARLEEEEEQEQQEVDKVAMVDEKEGQETASPGGHLGAEEDTLLAAAADVTAADVVSIEAEPKVAEEKSTPIPELENKTDKETLPAPCPLAAEVHRAAAQIKTDLLELVKFNTKSLLNTQVSEKEEFPCVWRAVNDALPVLVAKGMAACDAGLETVVAPAVAVADVDELSALRTAFVDALISNLHA